MTDEGSSEPSYIDYETFLSPDFSPQSFANTLVQATNNPSDTELDLSTPLSRVLFDVQDIDTRIDALTSKSALLLLNHTRDDSHAGTRILNGLEEQVALLSSSYERLQKEVIDRHSAAQETRVAAERLWRTVKLARAVGRCLTLARQLEAQVPELGPSMASTGGKREDFGAMVRCANTLISLRCIFRASEPGEEGEDLDRIRILSSMRTEMLDPAEERCATRAEQIVSQFSMSALAGSQQDNETTPGSGSTQVALSPAEDTRSRATSALLALYLLSPLPSKGASGMLQPGRLVSALTDYLRRAITSSVAGVSSALSTLPKLERTLTEVSARCQNIVALELLLESIKPPEHPLVVSQTAIPNTKADAKTSQLQAPSDFLQPLLHSLDTSSLPSYFWRSMAGQLSARTQKIMRDGGVSARTLRSNKERVRDALKDCVNRGSQLPASSLSKGKGTAVRNWEREAAVMVGSILNQLGR